MAKSTKVSTGSDVRAWATENGFEVGARGRFKPEVIKAFNKAHRGAPYAEGNRAQVEVKVGRKTVRASTSDLRAAAASLGLAPGERGALKRDVLAQAAAHLASQR